MHTVPKIWPLSLELANLAEKWQNHMFFKVGTMATNNGISLNKIAEGAVNF